MSEGGAVRVEFGGGGGRGERGRREREEGAAGGAQCSGGGGSSGGRGAQRRRRRRGRRAGPGRARSRGGSSGNGSGGGIVAPERAQVRVGDTGPGPLLPAARKGSASFPAASSVSPGDPAASAAVRAWPGGRVSAVSAVTLSGHPAADAARGGGAQTFRSWGRPERGDPHQPAYQIFPDSCTWFPLSIGAGVEGVLCSRSPVSLYRGCFLSCGQGLGLGASLPKSGFPVCRRALCFELCASWASPFLGVLHLPTALPQACMGLPPGDRRAPKLGSPSHLSLELQFGFGFSVPPHKLFVKVALHRFALGPHDGPLYFWTPGFTLGLVTPDEKIFWP